MINGLWDRDQFRGSDLHRKTIGIIGLGRLGKMVATYAQAFGMHTCYFDPLVESESHDKYHSLESLCATADVISLHVNFHSKQQSFQRSLLSCHETLSAVYQHLTRRTGG